MTFRGALGREKMAGGFVRVSPCQSPDEGAFMVVRPLVNPIGATPAPVTGRAACPENPVARPVPSLAEIHLGKLPC